MIHMGTTEMRYVPSEAGGYEEAYFVYCNCGRFDAGPFPTRHQARVAGDAHLAVANGPKQ